MLLIKLPNICRLLLILIAVIFLFTRAKGQQADPTINIATIQNSYALPPEKYQVAVTHTLTAVADIPSLDYEPIGAVIPATGKLGKNINSKYIYIKIRLANRSDTAKSIFLYPGHYFKSFQVFRRSAEGMVPVTNPVFNDAYRSITIAPAGENVYYALLQPVKIQVNTFKPQLVHPNFLKLHIEEIHNNNDLLNIITFILVGIMYMMVVFSFSNYLFNRKKEYLYYSLYAFTTATVLFLKAQLNLSNSSFNYFFEEYLDFMLFLGGLLFYIAFLRKFLSINSRHYPLLHKVVTYSKAFIIISGIVYSLLYFLTDNLNGLELIEVIMKYILVAGGMFFIAIGLRQRNRLMNYIVYGNACVIVFGFVSLTITMAPVLQDTVLSHPLFYYEMGIVGEFSFFLVGLTYKSRMELIHRVKREEAITKKEEKLELEKQLAIMKTHQDERNRISADMHDELGGGMTAIRLLSELAKQRTTANELPEIEKISDSANDLLYKMNAIIWSMKVANDTLESLVSYIKSFTHEYFENSNISYEIETPESVPETEVSGIKRRNIFLSYKEVLKGLRNLEVEKVMIVIRADDGITIKLSYAGGQVSKMEERIKPVIRKRMETIEGTGKVISGNGENYVFLQMHL